jgi:hypothetical protein
MEREWCVVRRPVFDDGDERVTDTGLTEEEANELAMNRNLRAEDPMWEEYYARPY